MRRFSLFFVCAFAWSFSTSVSFSAFAGDEPHKMPATHSHAEKPASGHSAAGHKPAISHGGSQDAVRPAKMPDHLDVARTRVSEQAKFSVKVSSLLDPVAINKIHSWVLHVRSSSGKSVENAKIHITGGMPEHGHGLPTTPRVTKYPGDGKYLIEGVRFNMAGWWELKMNIDSGHHKDKVTFNIVLK